MTIQILGAMLIVCAAGYVGVSQSMTLRLRTRELNALHTALELMRHEIQANQSPLADVCMLVSLNTRGQTAQLFDALARGLASRSPAGVQALAADALRASGLPLQAMEHQALLDLAAAMGRFDLEGQLRALELASDRFARFARQAESQQREKSRSYSVLGVCAGLALVILFA